jgi:HK97 family phage prohead protease
MAKYTQSQIDDLGKKGQAFGPDADGHYSYPVADHEDVTNAIHAVGRGAADHNKIRRFIMARAKAIGAVHLIPDNWNTDGSLRKQRWSGEQRAARGGVEQRREYRGHREDRRFGIGVTNAPQLRAGTTGNSTAATISGSPIVYNTPYSVNDRFGSFVETVAGGAVSAILPTTDTRFLVEHDGLALARTASGTLVLTDTPSALTCRATLDPRSPAALEVILAVGRGDVSQMSIGMCVADDEWSDDMSRRVITRIGELLDVSVVSFPASPTTSVELLAVPEELQPLGGDDGTLGAPFPPPGSGQDGTGSRTRLLLETDLLRLSRPSRSR